MALHTRNVTLRLLLTRRLLPNFQLELTQVAPVRAAAPRSRSGALSWPARARRQVSGPPGFVCTERRHQPWSHTVEAVRRRGVALRAPLFDRVRAAREVREAGEAGEAILAGAAAAAPVVVSAAVAAGAACKGAK
jgi:hypothetical protein